MSDQRIFIPKKTALQSLKERRRLRVNQPEFAHDSSHDDLRLPIALLIVFLCIATLFFLFRQIDPSLIADWIIPNSYFPVVVLLFFLIASGLYCFFLEIRRPIWWAFFFALIFELKFQQLLSFKAGFFFLLPFALSEVVLSWSKIR